MLATLIELADEANRLAYAIANRGKKQLRKPIQIDRPQPERRRRSARPEDVHAFFLEE